MRDRENPQVVEYLQAENAHTEAVLAPTLAFQEALFREMRSRIQETDRTAPYLYGPYAYYSRTLEGMEYRIYCRVPRFSLDGGRIADNRDGAALPGEEIVLDVNQLAEGRSYLGLGGLALDDRHERVAYLLDDNGDERFHVFVKTLATGHTEELGIFMATYGLEWGPSGDIFYTLQDDTGRSHRVYRRPAPAPGTSFAAFGADDELLYEEGDDRFFLSMFRSRDDRFLLLISSSKMTTEVRFLDFEHPEKGLRLVEPRRPGLEYEVEPCGDRFFIRANDIGPNFRVAVASVDDPGREAWTEFIPHRPDVLLQNIDGLRDHLILWEREGGSPHLRVREIFTGLEHRIAMPEDVYRLDAEVNAEFDSGHYRFAYSSPTTPRTVFDYDLRTRQSVAVRETPILGNFDHRNYASERIFATAPDGTRVPISLVYRTDTPRDGTAPLLLEGYGAYGVDVDLGFDHTQLTLLDRGVIFAIAHVRGGEEMGRHWYETGKLLQKKNTFTDFIAVAEHLIAGRYTASDRLAIEGGSAGGLLIGAVLNSRPDLFRAAVADVPFVDVLNTMWDESLPLTVHEFEEWGNPKEREYYDYIRSYSPYDNVKRQEYPHLLVLAGLNDPRVSYWEPAKWTARLREMKVGDQLLLLKTNMDAGHQGASGRYESLRERALIDTFILDRLGRRVLLEDQG